MGAKPSYRLFEYEHSSEESGGYLHLRVPVFGRILPEDASDHLRTAFRELYLAGTSLVRVGLDQLDAMVAEEQGKPEPPAG